MATKLEREKRHAWKNKAAEVIREIDKTSAQIWIKRVCKYLDDCDKENRPPIVAKFFKIYNMWIYWLRDELNRGTYASKKFIKAVEKYKICERIIKEGKVEVAFEKNIGTASFATTFLQQEGVWEKDETPQLGSGISINVIDFNSLPAPTPPQLPQVKQVESTIIDNIIDEDNIQPVISKEVIDKTDLTETLKDFLGEKKNG